MVTWRRTASQRASPCLLTRRRRTASFNTHGLRTRCSYRDPLLRRATYPCASVLSAQQPQPLSHNLIQGLLKLILQHLHHISILLQVESTLNVGQVAPAPPAS